jgi:hypothetical protein
MRRASHKTQTIWIRSHKCRRRPLRDCWSKIRNKKLVKVKHVPYLFFAGYRKCVLGNWLTSVYQNANCSLHVNLFCLLERGLEFAYCKFKTKEAGDFSPKKENKRGEHWNSTKQNKNTHVLDWSTMLSKQRRKRGRLRKGILAKTIEDTGQRIG